MDIIKKLINKNKYDLKCPYKMTAEFIVVHNTYNNASALSEINYMIGNDSSTSFHYAIDDKDIVQAIPENRNAWHSGDGRYGEGNRKGIGVEICYSKGGGERFKKAELLASKFIAYKLHEKGWGIDRVKTHKDFSGKYCPHRTLDMGWQRFLNMVKKELDLLEKTHWAEKHYNSLNEKGVIIHEKNYDNNITRGEVFALLDRLNVRR